MPYWVALFAVAGVSTWSASAAPDQLPSYCIAEPGSVCQFPCVDGRDFKVTAVLVEAGSIGQGFAYCDVAEAACTVQTAQPVCNEQKHSAVSVIGECYAHFSAVARCEYV